MLARVVGEQRTNRPLRKRAPGSTVGPERKRLKWRWQRSLILPPYWRSLTETHGAVRARLRAVHLVKYALDGCRLRGGTAVVSERD